MLGDPGAGKTTFVKYLALRLARGEGVKIGLTDYLPILLPLAAFAECTSKREIFALMISSPNILRASARTCRLARC
ncbi:MAG: hypothetical protein IPN96_15880 [Anaerolineales bacterium]|nr:hypothetical protein [Anaerolineales bacterium]